METINAIISSASLLLKLLGQGWKLWRAHKKNSIPVQKFLCPPQTWWGHFDSSLQQFGKQYSLIVEQIDKTNEVPQGSKQYAAHLYYLADLLLAIGPAAERAAQHSKSLAGQIADLDNKKI